MIKFINDHKGGVTVFITLILVPAVLFVGVFLDLSIMLASNMGEPLKLEAESALTNYNGLLKDVYGLFAYSDDYDYSGTIMQVNIDPFSSAGTEINNQIDNDNYFVPRGTSYQSGTSQSAGSYLSNTAILQTQISDYMKYRAPAMLLSEISNLEGIASAVTGAGDDSAVTKSSCEVAKEMEKMEKATKELYDAINDFDSFDINALSMGLTILTNEKIDELSAHCDALREKEAQLAAAEPSADDAEDPDAENSSADLQKEIDDIKGKIDACTSEIKEYNSAANLILLNAKTLSQNLDNAATSAHETQKEVIKKYDEFEKEYNKSSEAMKKGLAETKAEFEQVKNADFTKISNIGATAYSKIENAFDENKAVITNNYESFDPANSSFPKISDPSLPWQRVRDTPSCKDICNLLDKWYAGSADGKDESKNTENKLGSILDARKEQSQKDAENFIGALNIPPAVRGQLMVTGNDISQSSATGLDGLHEDVAKVNSDYQKSGMDLLLNFGKGVLNKVFVAEYDLAMFSCSSTGKLTDEDGNKIVEETISGIPKSPKMNYLYQSELEYLFVGGNNAKGNILATQSTILGLLTVRNFAASFSNDEWNRFIDGICKFIPHPAVKIAMMLSIRLLASGIEGGIELSNLVNGKEAELFKSKDGWYLSLSSLDEIGTDKELTGITFEYEHLMRVFLLAFVDEGDLLKRTGSLIELNMTNYNLGCNANGTEMPSLDFKMSEASVAVSTQVNYKITPLLNTFKMFNLDASSMEYGVHYSSAGY